MSCYEWESGTIKLPASEYVSFRKAIISAHNTLKQNIFNIACAELAKLKQATKGLRKEEKLKVAQSLLSKNANDEQRFEIEKLIFAFDDRRNFVGFKNPKKKDMGLLPLSKGSSIQFEDANIVFNDKNKTVLWDVGENNHAVESARGHILGRLFFKLLHSINWTRNSGGIIIGNDEYNRDSDYEGGGANYAKDRFGPLGKRQ